MYPVIMIPKPNFTVEKIQTNHLGVLVWVVYVIRLQTLLNEMNS